MIYEQVTWEKLEEARAELVRLGVCTLRQDQRSKHQLVSYSTYVMDSDGQETTYGSLHQVFDVRSNMVHVQLAFYGHDEAICLYSSMHKPS